MADSGESSGGGFWRMAWYGLGLIALAGIPARLYLGQAFWALEARALPQVFVMGSAYLILVAVVGLWGSSKGRWPIYLLGLIPLVFLAAFSFRFVRDDIQVSAGATGIAVVLATAFVVLERGIRHSHPQAGLTAAAGLAALGLTPLLPELPAVEEPVPEAMTERLIVTALHPVTMTSFDGVIEPDDRAQGGGIERIGDDLVVVTGSGAFYRLGWAVEGDSLGVERLRIPSPLDTAALSALDGNLVWYRVTGLLPRPHPQGWEVFVAHHHWVENERCAVLRVSSMVVDTSLHSVHGAWHTEFETRPCLPLLEVRPAQSGGQMAWIDDDALLLTVGDHAFDGWNQDEVAAQDDRFVYGKTVRVDVETGEWEVFTEGHRNPQGLWVGGTGERLWLTEHGPQGGDELNLLVRGSNFGWPYRTYGTDYGLYEWPVPGSPPEGASFTPPVFSWVPSIGVSSVIQVEGADLSEWRGDLLVNGMGFSTLYRLRTEGERVVYAEPIPIQKRVRDIIEGPGGRIWLYADDGSVATLSLTEDQARGAELYSICADCHDRTGASGPLLSGIVDRPVAARSDFEYSEVLRSLRGRWTEERLDAFIADPSGFAPGTTMVFPGLPDAEDRRSLIEFLRDRPGG